MMNYSRILPLLIIVAILSFSVRLTEVFTGVSNLSASAYAKADEEEKPDHEAKEKDAHKANGEKTHVADAPEVEQDDEISKDEKGEPLPDGDIEHVEGETAKVPKWQDASDSNLDVAEIKLEMFEDLSKRRDRLEEVKKALQVREALLKAVEKELDEKVTELKTLREEITSLLEEKGGKESERINTLVKIYEGMKPKDAARIFDTLDIDVLVRVMSKMSERKISPVLAAMNAERARTVTIMMAEEKTLPIIE